MKSGSLIVLAAALLLVSACSNGPNSSYEELGDRVNTKGFGHQYAQPEDQDELVLAPGDALDIQIANNPALSGAQVVRIEGVIFAPFVGDVKVAGLTATQIRDKLQILIDPFIRDVTVQVIPTTFNSKRIYIYATDELGGLQGRAYRLQGDMTLIDLISQLGGVATAADDCHIKIIRGDPRHPKSMNINVRDMILNGYTAANVHLKPDDIVYMPPTFFAKVAQFLNRITYPVRSVFQSLTQASSTAIFLQTGALPRRGGTRGGGGQF